MSEACKKCHGMREVRVIMLSEGLRECLTVVMAREQVAEALFSK